MPKKKDSVVYNLMKDGKKVYTGVTNDPKRRASEHKCSGKDFDKMVVDSNPMTKKSAHKKEVEAVKKYEKSKGDKPKYNKYY